MPSYNNYPADAYYNYAPVEVSNEYNYDKHSIIEDNTSHNELKVTTPSPSPSPTPVKSNTCILL